MARPRKDDDEVTAPKRPPATTPQARENQLISVAIDVAERQMRDGTASSQVITHFLKLASVRENLERDKLIAENKLLQARVENMASNERVEELYSEAIKAMRSYQGEEAPPQEHYVD